MLSMLAAVLIFTGVVITPLVNSIDFTPPVSIDSGKLRGFIVEVNNTGGAKVRKYLGIPYAQAERFQLSKPPSQWHDVKNMTTLGKACPQLVGTVWASKMEDINEDCLNLNVFVPDDSNSSSLLPVMVWIHGGGYIMGSNRENMVDGKYIAALGKVVVVAINYRLSAFGFLTNGKDGDIKGNYGMLDQVEALKWVKRNIAQFNGDPNKVTIFGGSAGGASVSLLMLSKQAKGLFIRAIPQSGSAAAPWATGTYESLNKTYKIFAKKVGCPEDLGKLRDCLKPKTTMQIIYAGLPLGFPSFLPVIDGQFIDDAPSVLYEKQQFDKIDVMTGVANDEGTLFTTAIKGLGVGPNITSRDVFLKALRGSGLGLVIPDPKSVLVNATIYRYTDWTDVSSPTRNRRMYVDLQGDMTFVSPAIKGAKAYVKKKAAAYFYYFEYRMDTAYGASIPSWVRAYHGADGPFVFGTMLSKETATTRAKFSREVIKMWTNFAKTGNPNNPDSLGVTWPRYSHDQQKYLSLKPNMTVNSHLRAEYVAYWNQFIPDALRATPIPTTPTPTTTPCPTCSPCGSADIKATAVMIFLMSIATTWRLL